MTTRGIRKFKHLSYLILFFFCWTNLGIYNIVYAATNGSAQGSVARGQQNTKNTEEKFQEALERLKDGVDKEDITKIKTERGEIESFDVEIKKQFKETEEKIKGLPEAVKQRHKDFVKKYEENLNTLKGHLDGIEKAKTTAEKQQTLQKAKDFLEKTKPPKKHVPLDPNKLPHRTIEPKFKEPKLKKEEFKKSSGQGSVASGRGTSRKQIAFNPYSAAMTQPVGWAVPTERLLGFNKQPIMVAANGPLTGLLSPNSEYSLSPSPLAGEGRGEGGMVLALNTPSTSSGQALPTTADLSETIEVQFTPDIKAKAQELGYNPVNIYEWVRNNIEYVPTYGSIQGADMCLQTKQCNDMDTASLLIALLRASNISARYVYGTIELPIDKVMNWVGGFTDATSAVNFIASGGVPIKAYASGGKIAKVQMEHVWVEAYVDMIPSGGAVHKKGDTWVPLDASYKQYTYKTGMDLYSSLSFNGDQFMSGYIADAQDITPYQYYQQKTMGWLAANMPNTTIEEIFGAEDIPSTKVIVQQTFPYLLGTLPYKVVVKGAKYSDLPDNLKHKVTFDLTGDVFEEGEITLIKSLPEISGKRLTLSYIPATASDENLVAQYGGDMLKVPPYLMNVKPVIKIDGVDAAIGDSVGMATNQTLTVSINAPNMSQDIAQHNIIVGQYSAVALRYGKTPVEVVAARMEQLINNSKNANAVSLDDLLGELLSNMGLAYFHHMTFEDDLYAKNFQMAYTKLASEALTAHGLDVTYIFGMPGSVAEGGMNIDADISNYAAQSLSGDKNRTKDFMNLSGMSGSAWEHKIFEMFFQTPSISAMKLLKYASQQGVPIYTIDSTNIGQMLPILQLAQEVTIDVQNAVNAGKKVIIHQKELQYYDWAGAGYVVLYPVTGVGGYMISGGLAGGGTSQPITGLNQNQTYMNSGGDPACGSGWNEPYVPEGIGNYNFTEACQSHDDCYGTCGSFRLGCDVTLFVDMLNGCSNIQWSEPPIDSLGCVEAAYIYLGAVIVFGKSAFNQAQEAACP